MEYVISDLKGEEIAGTFYKEELIKIISFNGWIDKKRHIINEWKFFRMKIFRKKSKSWSRFIWLYNKSRFKNVTGDDISKFANKVSWLSYFKIWCRYKRYW